MESPLILIVASPVRSSPLAVMSRLDRYERTAFVPPWCRWTSRHLVDRVTPQVWHGIPSDNPHSIASFPPVKVAY